MTRAEALDATARHLVSAESRSVREARRRVDALVERYVERATRRNATADDMLLAAIVQEGARIVRQQLGDIG